MGRSGRARLGNVYRHIPVALSPVDGSKLVTILGVTYSHLYPKEGGDLYLTRFGIQLEPFLRLENWYERSWFEQHRQRLEGTSAVFRVPSRTVDGHSIDLVVKNCRVGEDVPVDTRTLEEALHAEFNSPWEEFALVMEMREGAYGPRSYSLCTQKPLAIYVPPEHMQLWQSGRSRQKMRRIQARNPNIELDILRQYKLVYEWIPGLDVVQLLLESGADQQRILDEVVALNDRATADMRAKGYLVADMKPQHIIITDPHVDELLQPPSTASHVIEDTMRALRWHVEAHVYSVIDYELLGRTEEHEKYSRQRRRMNYIEELGHRNDEPELPENLLQLRIRNVPYVTGPVESTAGQLWVVGQNPRLFDFFLPERWRRTALWRLAKDVEISYTVTKDGVHLLWTPSRGGERVSVASADGHSMHYRDPFTVFGILRDLAGRGVPVVAPRAIYMTGTTRSEPLEDESAFHLELMQPTSEGSPPLRPDRNYMMLFGFYCWVGERPLEPSEGAPVPHPVGLALAVDQGWARPDAAQLALENLQQQITAAGYDASVLTTDDLLVNLAKPGELELEDSGLLAVRLHDAELLVKR